MASFHFQVEKDKCTQCGACLKTCSSSAICMGEDGYPRLREGVDGVVGWWGCYRCQHCLAVCPQGAIRILDKLRRAVRDRTFELAEQGIYPQGFSEEMFASQVDLEPHRNPGDMFFVNAPHMLIIHSAKGEGQWQLDPVLATAWFDLICAAYGLGCAILSFPLRTLANMPDIVEQFGINETRHYSTILVFGYPETEYVRGVQREGIAKTTELVFDL